MTSQSEVELSWSVLLSDILGTLTKLDVKFAFIWLKGDEDEEEFPGITSGMYVEQDGRSMSSASLLSCHSCSIDEEVRFSGASAAFKSPPASSNFSLF